MRNGGGAFLFFHLANFKLAFISLQSDGGLLVVLAIAYSYKHNQS
jgi:hypothetical protein